MYGLARGLDSWMVDHESIDPPPFMPKPAVF
jgi:hypothetical protein